MRQKKTRQLVFCFVIIAFAAAFWQQGVLSAAEKAKVKVVVIANKDVKDASLSQNDVENIFLGKKSKWSDNKAINFVILNSGDVHTTFLKDFVGKTKSQFDSYWKKQVFTGKGKKPKSYKKEKDLLDYIAKTKGAIGYVSQATLDSNKDKVKQITVK